MSIKRKTATQSVATLTAVAFLFSSTFSPWVEANSIIPSTPFHGNIHYDHGRELSYQEKSNEKSLNPDDPLDKTITLDRSGLTYNSDGLLNSFNEVSNDVARNVSATTYDSQGNSTGS